VNIKKGDTVEIIAGKDRGKRGEILKVLPITNQVVVQGLNQRKKHKKAQEAQVRGGQTAPEILIFDAPLDASNVMLICPKCGELTRIARHRSEAGRPQRMCKRCDAIIDG